MLFMHWPVDADAIARHLPVGMDVDRFDGQAWIGVVPFRMDGVAPRYSPDIPGLSRFPELNVRTYVTVGGKPGVWFFSLDATNPVAVRAARNLFHLKYMDANIELRHAAASEQAADRWIDYHSCRTHRGEPPAELRVRYRPVGEGRQTVEGSLEHFLTSRYCLYSANRSGVIYRGEIDHQPWRIHDAVADVEVNTMTNGLEIPLPNQPPLLHYSASIDTVAWLLARCEG